MDPSEQPQTFMAFAEVFGPLVVGIIQGFVMVKFVLPRTGGYLGGLLSVVRSRANTLFTLVQMAAYLGVVATCNAAYAPQTLDWLQARDILPFAPSLLYLRVAAAVSAYLLGSSLVHLLSLLSDDDTETNTLEPLPLKDRRPR